MVVLCILAGIGSATVLRWLWHWSGSHPNQVAAREASRRRGLLARLLKKGE